MRIIAAGDSGTAPADPEHFTGPVWRTPMIKSPNGETLSGQRLVYAPGARSHWHAHTAEQVLVVLEGRGLVEWEGGSGPQPLSAGDWVHVSPGVPHWHGADEFNTFEHIAVAAGGETQRYGPVPPVVESD